MKNFTLLLFSSLLFAGVHAQVLESDFSAWESDLPVGWYGAKSNIAQANVLQADNSGGQGDFAVELVNTESGHKRFTSQALTVVSGTNYEITFSARGTGDVRSGIYDEREDGFGYAYNSYVSVDSDTWTEYTQSIVAGENSDLAEFIFSVRNTAGDMNVQIDHVVITTTTIETVSIYDIQYTTEPDGASPLVDQTVMITGIVTAVGNGGYFLQDNGGDAWNGIFVYAFETPMVGDEVLVAGTVAEHFGHTQLASTTGYTVLSSGNDVVTTDISTTEVNTEEYESVLVRVTMATCIDANSGFGQFIVDDGSGGCFINPTIYEYDATDGELYNITGPTFYGFDEYKIMPRTAEDVEVYSSVNEITSADGISIFPLPAADVVNINWVDASGEVAFQVYDLRGQLVQRGSVNRPVGTIDVSALTPGMYSLTLESAKGLMQTRIVVK